jgi:hypothetical protein
MLQEEVIQAKKTKHENKYKTLWLLLKKLF